MNNEPFDEHLAWLSEHCRVTPMTPTELRRPVEPGDRPHVMLTFDDGYDDNFTHALPRVRLGRSRCRLDFQQPAHAVDQFFDVKRLVQEIVRAFPTCQVAVCQAIIAALSPSAAAQAIKMSLIENANRN